jgi:hypothetical protein
VRERRIPKAIKPEDEGSPDKRSQRKEASVILKTTEKLEFINTLVLKTLEITLDH